jgi:Fibronectin type III domain
VGALPILLPAHAEQQATPPPLHSFLSPSYVQNYEIHNTQTSGTGTYDQLMVVDSATYSSHLATNLSNTNWTYTANGTQIQSWIETNASNAATHTNIWLKLYNIPASGYTNVSWDMYSTSTFVLSEKGSSGEASQLSATYAEFDNGWRLFPFYENWSGSSLPAGFSTIGSWSGSVSSGLTVTSSSGSSELYTSFAGTQDDVFVNNYTETAHQVFNVEFSQTTTAQATGAEDGYTGTFDNSGGGTELLYRYNTGTDTSLGTKTQSTTLSIAYRSALSWYGTAGNLNYFWRGASGAAGVTGALAATDTTYTTSSYLFWGVYTGGTFLVHESYVYTPPPNDVMPTAMADTYGPSPTGLTVTGTTSSTISVSWTDPTGIGARVNDTAYIGTVASCGSPLTGHSVGATGTTYTFSGLASNEAYYFWVTFWNSTTQTGPSACVSDTTSLLAPTGVSAAPSGSTWITVSWTNQPGGGSLTDNHLYEYAGLSCGGSATTVNIGSVVTSEKVTGLTTGTPHSYEVTASNSVGEGPKSSCASTTTLTPVGAAGWITSTAVINAQNYTLTGFSTGTTSVDGSTEWDTVVTTPNGPSGVLTAYYLTSSFSELSSFTYSTGTVVNLHAWTPLGTDGTHQLLAPYQTSTGAVPMVYSIGVTSGGDISIEEYWLSNSTFVSYTTSTVISGTAGTGTGVIDSQGDGFFVTGVATGTIYILNPWSDQTHTASYSNGFAEWNSPAFFPVANSALEECNNPSNNTVVVWLFNYSASTNVIGQWEMWSPANAIITGPDYNDQPFFYQILPNGTVFGWGVGSNNNAGTSYHLMDWWLYPNMQKDAWDTVSSTGYSGTTDQVVFAFLDPGGYALNGYNRFTPNGTYQSLFDDPLTLHAVYASNAPWLNQFVTNNPFGYWTSGTLADSFAYVGTNDTQGAVQNGSVSMVYNIASQPGVPAAPTGLTVGTITTTSIQESWTLPPGGGTNSTVYWSTGAGCTGTIFAHSLGTAGTSYTITGLTQDVRYYSSVAVWNSTGSSPDSSCVSALTASVPSAPTGLSLSPTALTTTLAASWSLPSGQSLVNVSIFWFAGQSCNVGAPSVHSTGSGSTTSYTITGLTTKSYVSAEVQAWNATGGSAQSACATGLTASVPPAPTGLTVSPTALTTTMQASWTLPIGDSLNNVTDFWFSGAACSGAPTVHSTGSGATTSYTITGLTTNHRYAVEVEAWNATGGSPDSSCISAVTASVPAAPTGLTIVSVTAVSIHASWSYPGTGGLINITMSYEAGSSCSGSLTPFSLGSVRNNGSILGLPGASEFCVEISVWNGTGQSAESSPATAWTLPAAPTGLTALDDNTTRINLTWVQPSGTVTDDHLYVYSGSSCTGTPTAINLGSAVTSYGDSGLYPGTPYSYTVTASSAGGAGTNSSCAAATTPGGSSGGGSGGGFAVNPVPLILVALPATLLGGAIIHAAVRMRRSTQ